MTRHSENIHSGLITRAVRKAIAWGAPSTIEDGGLEEAAEALGAASSRKEAEALRELIETHLSVSINDNLYAWECARSPGEKREARAELAKTRARADEIARRCGISSRARMVR